MVGLRARGWGARMRRLLQEAAQGGDAEAAEASAMSMSRRKRAFTGRLGDGTERGQRGRFEAGFADGGRRQMEIDGAQEFADKGTDTWDTPSPGWRHCAKWDSYLGYDWEWNGRTLGRWGD